MKAFDAREKKLTPDSDDMSDETRKREVMDAAGDGAVLDMVPESPVEVAIPDLHEKDRRQLKEFSMRAVALKECRPQTSQG